MQQFACHTDSVLTAAEHNHDPQIRVFRIGHRIVLVTCRSHRRWAKKTGRGFAAPNANGVAADDRRLPDTWDQEQNVLWKVTIPGWGWGSPIVWGDRVFVSAVFADEDYEKPKGGLYLRRRARRTARHGASLDGLLPEPEDRRGALEARSAHRQARDSAASQEHLRRRNAHDRRQAAVRAVRRRRTVLLRLRRQAALDPRDRTEENEVRLRRGRFAGRAGRPGDHGLRQRRRVVHRGHRQRHRQAPLESPSATKRAPGPRRSSGSTTARPRSSPPARKKIAPTRPTASCCGTSTATCRC